MSTDKFEPANDEIYESEDAHWSTFRTGAAELALLRDGVGTWEVMGRNFSGDWGEASPEQVLANEASLKTDTPRTVSVFQTSRGERIYVATDFEGHRTEILLESEYEESPTFSLPSPSRSEG
jgi:hypothetical protein